MSRRTWKKLAFAVLAGGTLLQVGSCATSLAPLVFTLGESTFLTLLFGRGF